MGGELRNHNSLVCWCVCTLTNVTSFIQIMSAPIILQLKQRLPSRFLTKKKTSPFKCSRRKLTEPISSRSVTSVYEIWWDREAIQYLVFVFWEHLNYRMVPVHLWSHHVDGGCAGLWQRGGRAESGLNSPGAGQCPSLSVLTDGRLCYLWPVTPTPTTPTVVDGWRRQNSQSL